MELKEKLKFQEGMTWGEIVGYYFPGIPNDKVMGFLIERTCYPFSTKETLDQLYRIYKSTISMFIKDEV